MFFALTAAVFFFVNRASYGGFFYGDDLNTLSWAKAGSLKIFSYWLAVPMIPPGLFRPVGGFFYRILGGTAGFWYPPYVAAVQVIHLANTILLFALLRRLQLPALASAAGSLFFLFHIAIVDVFWKPMYVFDLLCGTFSLVTLLLYLHDHWIAGLLAFWLACKSKELAVMVPLVLASYELLLANRRWKRLIPYFAITVNFGIQGLLRSRGTDDAYTLHFSFRVLWNCLTYYAKELFLNEYVAIYVIIALLLVRDRRLHFGFLAMLLFLAPLLALPGRLYSAYWYVPLIGVAVMIAVVCARSPRWLVLGGLALWLAGNYALFTDKAKEILAAGGDNRVYFETLSDVAHRHPELKAFGYDGYPPQMYEWGVEGAVHLLFNLNASLYPASSAEFAAARSKSPACVLRWDQSAHKLYATIPPP